MELDRLRRREERPGTRGGQPALPRKVRYECSGTEYLIDEHYSVSKQIGVGAYGFVASGVNRLTGQKVAVKKVHNAFSDLIDAKRILREIKLLKFLDHPNIVSILDLLRPESRTGYKDVYIVTELLETDMHKVIYSKQELSDDHVQYFVYQLLRGLHYLHSANVIHRDLKPSNLLLNKKCDLKICDFGLARGYEDEDERKTEYVVTRWYRAPEVILNASEYTKAVDLWSVGCILAELLGKAPLFPGEDYLDQVQRIISVLGTPSPSDMRYIGNEQALKYIRSLPKRSKHSFDRLFAGANPLALDLLGKLLTFDPERRVSAEEALAHPYFEDIREEDKEITCERAFDWSWDDFKPTKELLQSMIYEESLSYGQPTRRREPSRAKELRPKK